MTRIKRENIRVLVYDENASGTQPTFGVMSTIPPNIAVNTARGIWSRHLPGCSPQEGRIGSTLLTASDDRQLLPGQVCFVFDGANPDHLRRLEEIVSEVTEYGWAVTV